MILGALLVSTLTAGFGRTIDISPEERKVKRWWLHWELVVGTVEVAIQ
jgi:hypothetical protein